MTSTATRSARVVEQAPDRVDVEEFLRHPRPSRRERRETGRGLRALVPLDAHACAPDTRDRDGLAVLGAQDAVRELSLVPIRYGRMAADPFAFLRGSAAVMAADLASVPTSGITVQLCGDAHVANFGLFAAPDRRVLFDLNDFDETLRGPFEWDVKRLAASLAVAARHTGQSDKSARRTVRQAVASYRKTIRRLAEAPTLDVWYLRLEMDELVAQLRRTALGKAAVKAEGKARRNTGDIAVAKMTETVNGVRRFRTLAPILVPVADEEVAGALAGLYAQYLASVPLECALLLARYSFRGLAHRVVGVGSVGTRALLMLLESGDGEPLLLQIKQANASVLEHHLGPSRFGSSHGRRVVAGQRLIQAAGDPFLGWTDPLRNRPYDYYVRQLRDMKGSIDAALLDPEALLVYGQLCAAVLARAHARAGDAAVIAGYLGGKKTFDVAVSDFAAGYTEVTYADHAALVRAVRDGRVDAEFGV